MPTFTMNVFAETAAAALQGVPGRAATRDGGARRHPPHQATQATTSGR